MDKSKPWGGFIPPSRMIYAGAYLITHVATGKVYAGSTKNIYRRLRHHRYLLEQNKHHCEALQENFNSDSDMSVTFWLLADGGAIADSDELLRNYEQSLLDSWANTGFLLNTAFDASSPMKGRTHSADSKAAIGAWGRGRVVSKDTREKLSAALRGVKHSPERIAKMVEVRKTAAWRKCQESSKGAKKTSIDGVVYSSVTEATKHLGNLSISQVAKRCRSEKYPTWFYV